MKGSPVAAFRRVTRARTAAYRGLKQTFTEAQKDRTLNERQNVAAVVGDYNELAPFSPWIFGKLLDALNIQVRWNVRQDMPEIQRGQSQWKVANDREVGKLMCDVAERFYFMKSTGRGRCSCGL